MRKVRFNVFQNNQALKELKTKGYSLYNFEEIFIDDSKNHIKIASNEYQITGNTAIVDQGQNLIVGFSDRIVKQLDKPRIIFGDHTKAVKFIDFPFILGADGTKVLKLIHESVLEKYVYYFLKYVEIPNLGYARHFKYIKELVFPIPSLSVQKDVINIFTKIDQQISLRQQQLQTLATLVKSRFHEMFGKYSDDGLLEVYIKELKAGKSLAGEEENINKVLKTGAVSYDYFNPRELKNLPIDYEPLKEHKVRLGDVIISRMNTAELVGAAGYVWNIDDNIYLPDRLWKVVLRDKVNAVFLWQLIIHKNTKLKIQGIASGTSGSMNNISKQKFLKIKVPIPPLALQNQFADFVAEVDKSQLAIKKSLEELKTLKKSLMQAYFG